MSLDSKTDANKTMNRRCIICDYNKGIYKFRCCGNRFCSVDCFVSHTKEECKLSNIFKNVSLENEENDKKKLIENEEEDDMVELSKEEIFAIDSNQKLKILLKENPELIEILTFVDKAENKKIALANVINDDLNSKNKIFNKFLELIAECLGEEFRNYKGIYDSMIYEYQFRKNIT